MITQRIVNNYPSWTKIRKDPSSFGFRFYSVIGNHFDFANAELKQKYLSFQLNKEGLGLGNLYTINLEDDDYMVSTATTGGDLTWAYPTVVGDSHGVTRIESLEELYWTVPNRLAVEETVSFANIVVATKSYLGTATINALTVPARLKVILSGSTNWFKRTSINNRLETGIHRVILTGYDLNGLYIKEDIDVLDDGSYFTRNIYSELLTIDTQGLDSDITIHAYNSKTVLEDPFHLAVGVSGIQGPLYLSLSYNADSSTSEILYYTSLAKRGEDYKDGSNEIPYNQENLWGQALLDSGGNEIQIVDYCFNPNTTRLYALDTTGKIHIYEYNLQSFITPTLQDDLSKVSYVDIDASESWTMYNDSLLMFTRFSRPRFPVSSVQIKRISPTGTINYLQADKSWSASAYSFPGDPNASGLFENTFRDIVFSSTFNEFGQWEFYCTTNTIHDSTVTFTGVKVDSLIANASIASGVSSGIALNYSDDNYLTITTGTSGNYTLHKIKEYSDVYYADEDTQTLFLREDYSSVSVSY